MLSVSHINTYENINSENSELELLKKNNAISYENDDTELSRFYEKETHKYNNNEYDIPSNSNTQKIEAIKLIEKKPKAKKITKKENNKEKETHKTHRGSPRIIRRRKEKSLLKKTSPWKIPRFI